MQMRTSNFVVGLIAGVVSAGGLAASGPTEYIGSPADAVKQQEVQAAAVYPQEGATSGEAASKLSQQRDTPPVLATTQEKHDAVAASAVYPQEGATSGAQAVKDRTQAYLPSPLATTRDKQDAVDSTTKANAGS
jgi:hypothetical protein